MRSSSIVPLVLCVEPKRSIRLKDAPGEGGSQKVKVKLKASVPKTEQGPTAKKWKTVVKKLPALGENILKPKRR